MGAGAAKPLPAMAAPLPSTQSRLRHGSGLRRIRGGRLRQLAEPAGLGRRNVRSISRCRSSGAPRTSHSGRNRRIRDGARNRSRRPEPSSQLRRARLPGAANTSAHRPHPEPRRSRRVVSRTALQSLVRLLGDALASEHERAGIRNQHLVQAALVSMGRPARSAYDVVACLRVRSAGGERYSPR